MRSERLTVAGDGAGLGEGEGAVGGLEGGDLGHGELGLVLGLLTVAVARGSRDDLELDASVLGGGDRLSIQKGSGHMVSCWASPRG